MSELEVYRVSGQGSAMLTTNGARSPEKIPVTQCDKRVPRASESIYGKCSYYYEPMMFGQIEAIEQSRVGNGARPSFPGRDGVDKTGVSTGEIISQLIDNVWKPLPLTLEDNLKMLDRVLKNHDALLDPDSDVGWSRYGNFWARHVGCGHVPPEYYTHYGYYYCSRYAAYLHPRLSPRGKQWMADARYYLQVYLDNALQMNMDEESEEVVIWQGDKGDPLIISAAPYELELESEKFKDVAFATHVNAYIDAGLAELVIPDLVRIGTMPNIEEWLDGATWDQAFTSAGNVLSDWREDPGAVIDANYEHGKHYLEQKISGAGELIDRALERLTSWF